MQKLLITSLTALALTLGMAAGATAAVQVTDAATGKVCKEDITVGTDASTGDPEIVGGCAFTAVTTAPDHAIMTSRTIFGTLMAAQCEIELQGRIGSHRGLDEAYFVAVPTMSHLPNSSSCEMESTSDVWEGRIAGDGQGGLTAELDMRACCNPYGWDAEDGDTVVLDVERDDATDPDLWTGLHADSHKIGTDSNHFEGTFDIAAGQLRVAEGPKLGVDVKDPATGVECPEYFVDGGGDVQGGCEFVATTVLDEYLDLWWQSSSGWTVLDQCKVTVAGHVNGDSEGLIDSVTLSGSGGGLWCNHTLGGLPWSATFRPYGDGKFDLAIDVGNLETYLAGSYSGLVSFDAGLDGQSAVIGLGAERQVPKGGDIRRALEVDLELSPSTTVVLDQVEL